MILCTFLAVSVCMELALSGFFVDSSPFVVPAEVRYLFWMWLGVVLWIRELTHWKMVYCFSLVGKFFASVLFVGSEKSCGKTAVASTSTSGSCTLPGAGSGTQSHACGCVSLRCCGFPNANRKPLMECFITFLLLICAYAKAVNLSLGRRKEHPLSIWHT